MEAALVRFRLILHSNRVSTAEVPEPGGSSRGRRYTASLQLSSLPSIHAFFVPRTTCTEEATVEPPTLRVEEEDSTTYTVANLETRSLLRTIPALLVVLCSVANFWERIIVLKKRQNSPFLRRSDFAKKFWLVKFDKNGNF